MSLITVTGTIASPTGLFPDEDSGSQIHFKLNGHLENTDDEIIVPQVISADIDDTDGTFSVDLHSTRDCVPSDRFYEVMLRATFDGVDVNYLIGRIQLRSTPSDQTLDDLLADTLIEITGDRYIVEDIGTGDGSTTVFEMTYPPVEDTETIYQGGLLAARTTDYAVAQDGTVTFVVPPPNGQVLLAAYWRA